MEGERAGGCERRESRGKESMKGQDKKKRRTEEKGRKGRKGKGEKEPRKGLIAETGHKLKISSFLFFFPPLSVL